MIVQSGRLLRSAMALGLALTLTATEAFAVPMGAPFQAAGQAHMGGFPPPGYPGPMGPMGPGGMHGSFTRVDVSVRAGGRHGRCGGRCGRRGRCGGRFGCRIRVRSRCGGGGCGGGFIMARGGCGGGGFGQCGMPSRRSFCSIRISIRGGFGGGGCRRRAC